MSRKNVWEILKNKEISNLDLENLLSDILSFASKFEYYYISFAASLGQKNNYQLFSSIAKLSMDTITKFLYLSEVFLTLVAYTYKEREVVSSEFKESLESLRKRIIYYLEKLNFTILVDENSKKVIVLSKSSVSESVSLIFSEKNDTETSWRILTYNSISISVEDKIDTIRFLYTKLEKLHNKSNDIKFKNIKRLSNYFRHHKDDYKTVSEIENDKEFYCDLAYNLMLEMFLSDHNHKLYNEHLEIIKKIRV